MSDRSNSEITINSPVEEGLDEYRRLFESTCADLGISKSTDVVERVVRLAALGKGRTSLLPGQVLANKYRSQKFGIPTFRPSLTGSSSGQCPSFRDYDWISPL
jgi:hypothetical protein